MSFAAEGLSAMAGGTARARPPPLAGMGLGNGPWNGSLFLVTHFPSSLLVGKKPYLGVFDCAGFEPSPAHQISIKLWLSKNSKVVWVRFWGGSGSGRQFLFLSIYENLPIELTFPIELCRLSLSVVEDWV